MKVLITGSSSGIGQAIANLFLAQGHTVIGIDIAPATIEHLHYTHYTADITRDPLPPIDDVQILINNAGVQNSGRDIDVNLKGTIRVTKQYGLHTGIVSVLFIASASASTGAEFDEYCASKGGLISYMKHVALSVAPYGATANSLSPGGVTTALNAPVMDDADKWQSIMQQTPLRKWASAEEIAQWAYFVTVVNHSMTAQDILIDNGEAADAHFVW